MILHHGKTAIITGASATRGIGRATAIRMAMDGASIAVTDVRSPENESALNALVHEIAAMGGHAMPVFVDVRVREEIDQCVDTVVERFGGIDILVNNAGTTIGAKPFLDITDGDWMTSFGVNLKGVADFCQAVIPGMVERGGGVIINNASTAGLGAEAGFGAYNATKHGLVGLTKTIAAEFGSNNIRCNAVCPGLIRTDMHLAANERLARERNIPVEEMAAEPMEVAEVISFLASDASSYVTGAAIPIAGGQSVGL